MRMVNYLRNRDLPLSVVSYLRNNVTRWTRPNEKIFFIGFNKCGTTAIHHFLHYQGIRSAHRKVGNEILTEQIERRLSSPADLKRYLSRWTAYSDLILSSEELMIDGHRHFRLFHHLFPNAYFVLNDRDIEAWIASLMRHREGELFRRSMNFHGLDEDGMKELWRAHHASHMAAVKEHFGASPRFLHFRIDTDPVEILVNFLRPSFVLNPSFWRRVNRSKARIAAR